MRHNPIEFERSRRHRNGRKLVVREEKPSSYLLIEVAFATIAALFAALTVLKVDWIERILPIDLDHHTGSLEWKLAAAVSVAAGSNIGVDIPPMAKIASGRIGKGPAITSLVAQVNPIRRLGAWVGRITSPPRV